ncbi:hypothetical protein A0O34_18120 [Chryseobacterium glaciei]|uniref:GLPGLI family protein n=1 Tax=Chryseobacterium glaciei TaxID=1685010 RepID=A0A172XZC8_9FLAO|nr:GLPGLI family protein [Chryseobacterium glaciei]ANF52314.1 hypothetical protein A0O34_18120 [Chryseobacterium glaciei]
MKKLMIAFITLLGILTCAQNQRFIYEYKFVKDSTEKDKAETELMYLDVTKKGSKFYSIDTRATDSLSMGEAKEMSGMQMATAMKGQISFIVEKSYPSYQTIFFDRLDNDINKYKVIDTRKLNWKILPDKEKIGEFTAQKATLDFAGRLWTAWFVSTIPIQDGPYKFKGLPGLIVKITDKTNSHIFELKGIEKLKENEVWTTEVGNQFERIISVDLKKYRKLFIEDRKNPDKMLSLPSSEGMTVMLGDNGEPMNRNEQIKELEKMSKERNAKDNNVLELDLLK